MNESVISQKLEDHEDRIRELEKINYKQEVTMANIEKSQADLKVLVLETNKEQSNMLKKFMEQILNNNTTTNQIRLIDRKESWGLAALVVGYLLSHIIK